MMCMVKYVGESVIHGMGVFRGEVGRGNAIVQRGGNPSSNPSGTAI